MRIVATLLVGVALAGSAGAAAVPNGLYGKVLRGPITPVCRVGTPCTGPASGAVLVFSRAGHVQGRVQAHKDGTYRIALPKGTYSVRVVPAKPMRPASAVVRQDRFRRVDFLIDTGIR